MAVASIWIIVTLTAFLFAHVVACWMISNRLLCWTGTWTSAHIHEIFPEYPDRDFWALQKVRDSNITLYPSYSRLYFESICISFKVLNSYMKFANLDKFGGVISL